MSIKYILITSLLALAVCVLSGVYHGVEITVEFIVYCYSLVLFIIALVFSGHRVNKNRSGAFCIDYPDYWER